jgi:phosphatidylglycerophosphate synthase
VIDRPAQAALKPLLVALARPLVAAGISADALTLLGFAVGIAAAAAIVLGAFEVGLGLMLVSRLLDGLDGTLARLTTATDRGAFLDIALDFVFYASIPLAFAVHDPAANGLPAALLLAAFVANGSSFLAFAVLAEKRGLPASEHPGKGFVFLGGLTEGGETLLCFALMCLWPQHFAVWALGFAALCAITWATRIATGWRRL